ncbi:YraN family protein [Nakamurella panacisegetis]|nr:YraN family protein [Nakamurella panacisegetis]
MASIAGNELGRRGEDLAAEHLEGLGLVILARNWRCREGELDIVATDGLRRLVVCEVKTRSGDGFGSPFEAVTRGKRRKLRRLAHLYLAECKVPWVSVRFDVVGVLARPGRTVELSHIVEAF